MWRDMQKIPTKKQIAMQVFFCVFCIKRCIKNVPKDCFIHVARHAKDTDKKTLHARLTKETDKRDLHKRLTKETNKQDLQTRLTKETGKRDPKTLTKETYTRD